LSIEGRQERGEKLGVLKTVQLHARSKHAFATATSNDSNAVEIPQPSTPDVTRPVIVRRNSTSTPLSSQSLDSEPPPPLAASPSRPTLPDTDPAAPQSTTEPVIDDTIKSSLYDELRKAMYAKNSAEILGLVQRMKNQPRPPHTAEFNMALEGLHETRRPGEPLNIILETYNDMIKLSVVPNTRTYLILILALTDRDFEVNKAIMSLKSKIKRRLRYEPSSPGLEENRIKQLLSENNFASAMSLFEAASAITWNRKIISISVYSHLIRSCALHSNIDAAIHVFAHLERRSDLFPSAAVFKHLMSVYMNVGDLRGVKDVFDEYRSALKEKRVTFEPESPMNYDILVWNKMIEASFRCGEYVGAMNLLEQMMDSKADEKDVTGIPSPSSSTFTHIIAGFCQAGDITSALSWFDRLLEQDSTARHPHETSTIPPKPDETAWMVMLEALALAKMVPELNRLFGVLVQNASVDGLEIRATDRVMLFEANMQYLDEHKDIPKEDAIKSLKFLTEVVLGLDESSIEIKLNQWGRKRMVLEIAQKYLQFGDPTGAFDILEPFVKNQLDFIRKSELAMRLTAQEIDNEMVMLRQMIQAFTSEFAQHLPASLENALRMLRLSDAIGFFPSAAVAWYYVDSYALSKSRGEAIKLELRDWELLMYASTALEPPYTVKASQKHQHHKGTVALLEDLKEHGVDLEKFLPRTTRRVIKVIFLKHSIEELQALFARLGPDYERALNNPGRDRKSLIASLHHPPKISRDIFDVVPPTKESVRIDVYHSRFVEEFFRQPEVTPLMAYSRFEAGAAKGIYPVPSAIGRLMNALGRLKEMDKVRTLYNAGQLVLSTLEPSSHWQSNGWFQVEDQMIIACAHAGEMDAAFNHRQKIIEQGGSPSADAYGGLIECVKDTTDDTSNAIALYRESKAVGCTPNVYLFNTIISKLAKARKADYALELFQEMKSIENIRPSSITYGALIGACSRVGDAISAEQLFLEMSEQPNFKPRIPPYNTMMQLYVNTKPNRERVLYYYDLLLKANLRPSVHTYRVSWFVFELDNGD
jgi:pentatricopeptide repeat protein